MITYSEFTGSIAYLLEQDLEGGFPVDTPLGRGVVVKTTFWYASHPIHVCIQPCTHAISPTAADGWILEDKTHNSQLCTVYRVPCMLQSDVSKSSTIHEVV